MEKYEALKNSGVEWIGEIPKSWDVIRLKYVSENNPSNVDKKSEADEKSIQLCNYVDVYKNDYISKRISFMEATASEIQIEKVDVSRAVQKLFYKIARLSFTFALIVLGLFGLLDYLML